MRSLGEFKALIFFVLGFFLSGKIFMKFGILGFFFIGKLKFGEIGEFKMKQYGKASNKEFHTNSVIF